MSKERYIRQTVEVHPYFKDVLGKLKTSFRLASEAEVIQKAVQIMAIVDDHGQRFYIDAPDGKLQIVDCCSTARRPMLREVAPIKAGAEA